MVEVGGQGGGLSVDGFEGGRHQSVGVGCGKGFQRRLSRLG